MREQWKLNLQIFGEGGGAAAASGGEGAGDSSAAVTPGTTLEDGTRVDTRLAERMERQRKRHPNRGGTADPAGGEIRNEPAPDAQNGSQGQAPEADARTPEQEFEDLIKGKYRNQYQARFQQALNERFRNQADLQGQLDGLKPMLDALAKQRGIQPGDYQALSRQILDDDSLYEDEAEAAGMTVEAYKSFTRLKAEAEAARQREQQSRQQREWQAHLANLAQQGEELKKIFPDFDLRTELNNQTFRRLTAPDSGLTVEQAYYAIHHRELAPQAMAAGIQRAQRQISQSLQANASRPVEGAMQGNAAAADIHIDPRNMTRAQREEIKARVRRGEKIVL